MTRWNAVAFVIKGVKRNCRCVRARLNGKNESAEKPVTLSHPQKHAHHLLLAGAGADLHTVGVS